MPSLHRHIAISLQITFLSVFICQSTTAQNANPPLTRVLFIFDASQSMYAQWEGNSRMEIAKELLANMLDSLDDRNNLEVGLRCYGHQKPSPPQDCRDTRLEVKFGKNNNTKNEKNTE